MTSSLYSERGFSFARLSSPHHWRICMRLCLKFIFCVSQMTAQPSSSSVLLFQMPRQEHHHYTKRLKWLTLLWRQETIKSSPASPSVAVGEKTVSECEAISLSGLSEHRNDSGFSPRWLQRSMQCWQTATEMAHKNWDQLTQRFQHTGPGSCWFTAVLPLGWAVLVAAMVGEWWGGAPSGHPKVPIKQMLHASW